MGLVADVVETRTTLASPAQWLRDALIGPRAATGRYVGPDQALALGAVWACVTLLSETIASLPWPVYRRLRPRGQERDPANPLYRLLHDAPNPEMTAFEFREAMVGHLETWGNAYAEIEVDQGSRPIALWPLRPDRMLVERLAARMDRRLKYTYTTPNGRSFVLPPERVLHWRGLSSDGLIGYPRLTLLREAVGLGLALEEYAARFFGNDGRPGGVLQHPGRLSQEAQARLKESWEAQHRGLDQAHRVAVLEEGITWQSIGLPPQDAQFVEARRFQVGEIARVFRVPPHMIGDLEKTSSWGAGVEQQSIGFVVYTLRPRLVRIEQATTKALFSPQEQVTHFAEFVVDGLLRGDARSRAAYLHQLRSDGIINANEWRELENLNPLPAALGGDYLVPLNMIPAEQLGAPPAPPAPPPAPPESAPPESAPPAPDSAPATERAAGVTVPPAAPAVPSAPFVPFVGGVPGVPGMGLLRDYRCRKCGDLLFRSADERGRIETVCANRRCRTIQTVLVGVEGREN